MAAERTEGLKRAGLRFQIGIAEEALAQDPDNLDHLQFLAHAYSESGRFQEGLEADRRLAQLRPEDDRVRYNLACSYALTGHPEEAFVELEAAIARGFDDAEMLTKDEDLDSLRGDPRFDALVQLLRSR